MTLKNINSEKREFCFDKNLYCLTPLGVGTLAERPICDSKSSPATFHPEVAGTSYIDSGLKDKRVSHSGFAARRAET